jgi:heme exporter protein D
MNLGFEPYGAYVWSSVALFALVVLGNAWAARAALRSALERARRVVGRAGR